MVPQILLSCTEWNPISVLRFTVCELQCQPDVWQLHLWCRPVPGTGRRRTVWASLPRLRMDRPLPGGWGSGHSTQTGLGASYPLPSVSLYHLKAWLILINEEKALFCQREVTGIQSDASVAWLWFLCRWFLKSCPESILVGNGKPACDFPLQFGEFIIKFIFCLVLHFLLSIGRLLSWSLLTSDNGHLGGHCPANTMVTYIQSFNF